MPLKISLRKFDLYARRSSSRTYDTPSGRADGRHADFSPLEKAHETVKAIDPNFVRTVELQKERHLQAS